MQRVAIHSVPRSGSTWLGSIFDSHPNVVYKYQPLFSFALKGYLTANSSARQIVSFFDKLQSIHDDFMDQAEAKKKGIVPDFEKSEPEAIVYKEVRYHHILRNMLTQDDGVKVIGLVRNPLDTIYSWWKAPKEFRADLGWNLSEEWLYAPSKNVGKPEEFNGYIKWKEVALIFEGLKSDFPNRFYLLDYHDLLHDTENRVGDLFRFCGLNYCTQTEQFINRSKNKVVEDPYSVFKKKDQSPSGSLPAEITDIVLNDIKGTSLAKYLRLNEFSRF